MQLPKPYCPRRNGSCRSASMLAREPQTLHLPCAGARRPVGSGRREGGYQLPYKTSRAETSNTHCCPRSQLSLGTRRLRVRIRAARHEVDPFLLNNLIVVLYRQTQSLAAAVIGRLAAVGSGYSRESGATEGGGRGAGARQCDKTRRSFGSRVVKYPNRDVLAS